MKTGYHVAYEKDYYEAIDLAKEYDFDYAQIDLNCPTFFLDKLSDNELQNIYEYSKDKGIQLSFHAPGDNVSLFCDYPKIRQGIMDQFKLIIEKANKLGARHITFHTGNSPEFKKENCLTDDYTNIFGDYYKGVLYDNINELIRHTSDTLICIENSGFNKLIIQALETIISDNNSLYLTLDTAKSYKKDFQFDIQTFEFMNKHQDRIREIHIHDFNKEYGKHQMIGSGIVDFGVFDNYLFKDNIYMTFEIRPIQSANVSRHALYKMFGYNI